MNVDTALRDRQAHGQPIRVGLVGAGATGRGRSPCSSPRRCREFASSVLQTEQFRTASGRSERPM